jgi:hypothetical protein
MKIKKTISVDEEALKSDETFETRSVAAKKSDKRSPSRLA